MKNHKLHENVQNINLCKHRNKRDKHSRPRGTRLCTDHGTRDTFATLSQRSARGRRAASCRTWRCTRAGTSRCTRGSCRPRTWRARGPSNRPGSRVNTSCWPALNERTKLCLFANEQKVKNYKTVKPKKTVFFANKQKLSNQRNGKIKQNCLFYGGGSTSTEGELNRALPPKYKYELSPTH